MAGSILKRGTKWQVTFEHGIDSSSGKRIRTTQTVKTESEAKKLLTEHNHNQARNLSVQISDMSVHKFLSYWMKQYVAHNCEETTIYGYQNILKHIESFLGNIKIQKLLPNQIQNYYTYLLDEKKLSPNTVHRHHAVLRKALDYALKQQFVYRNVADAVSLPKKKRYLGKAYTKEELQLLIEKVKGTRLELPVYLAAFLGLRREEIAGLKWDVIDFNKRTLKIEFVRTSAGSQLIEKVPKTEKSRRELYIVDELLLVLQNHKARKEELKKLLGKGYCDNGYVFVRDDGKPHRVNSVTEWFKEFLEKNELPKIRLHDLRHTFSSILFDEGVELFSISKALGHSDIGTTSRIYTHLFDQTHKNTMSAMSNAIKKQ